MNTTQLECFLSVAEYLNFSKAASFINISQPAVSHQISSLEDELGVKLFVRNNKSVQLTSAGVSFLSDADTILKIAVSSKKRLNSRKSEQIIKLGIGCHNQGELDAAVPVIKKFYERHSEFFPFVQTLPFKSMDNMLSDNKIQVLFAVKDISEKSKAEVFTEICRCGYAAIYPENTEMSDKKSVSAKELNGRMIILERHKCSDALINFYNKIGAFNRQDDIYFADGYENALALIRAGLGYTVFPLLPNMQSQGLCILPIKDIDKISFGIYSKPPKDNPIVEEFIKTAIELFK